MKQLATNKESQNSTPHDKTDNDEGAAQYIEYLRKIVHTEGMRSMKVLVTTDDDDSNNSDEGNTPIAVAALTGMNNVLHVYVYCV